MELLMEECPSVDRLQELLAGRLPSAEDAAVCAHVEGCVHCQALLDRLVESDRPEAWSLPKSEAPDMSQLLARLRTHTPPPPWIFQPSRDTPNGPDEANTVHFPPHPPPGPGVSPPVCLPGYELLEYLGRGGIGIVYRARQLGLDRMVAVKMILPTGEENRTELDRFRVEAEVAASLDHPNIIRIFDVGGGTEHDAYYAMEFANGGSLREQLKGSFLTYRQIAELVETLARGIDFAHQKGVIHRDLKPENILLHRSEDPTRDSSRAPFVAKISDFGIAKRRGDLLRTPGGRMLGTPGYMAPEQVSPDLGPLGPATDIYALGVILYEMLTGKNPFQAGSWEGTLAEVLKANPDSPRALRPAVPRDLEVICLKCLRHDPQERYLDAAGLANDLNRFLAGRPIQARPAGLMEKAWKWVRRNPGSALLTAAVSVLLLLVVILLVLVLALHQRILNFQVTRARAADAARLAEYRPAAPDSGPVTRRGARRRWK
jgi:serine/threonine protein kinase